MNDNLNEAADTKETAPLVPVLTEDDIRRAKKKKWLAVWDKITTGILILLMCSPVLILAYIFIWFIKGI